MLKEFKAFAIRGNVVDMAVGIIIGLAFGKIVTSLVNDIIMPPVGMLLAGAKFSELFINLSSTPYETLAAARAAGAPTINVGVFINTVLDFVIVAFVIFLVVRQMNKMKAQPAKADPTTKACPACLSTIPIKATKCAFCTSNVK